MKKTLQSIANAVPTLVILDVFTLLYVVFLSTYGWNTLLPAYGSYDPLLLPSPMPADQVFRAITTLATELTSKNLAFWCFAWAGYCVSVCLIVWSTARSLQASLGVFIPLYLELTVFQSLLGSKVLDCIANNVFSLIFSLIIFSAFRSKLFCRLQTFGNNLRSVITKVTMGLLVFSVLILAFFGVQILCMNSSVLGSNYVYIMDVFYFLWGFFLFLPLGLVVWRRISHRRICESLLDVFLIMLLGIVSVGGLAWFFLEIEIFLEYYAGFPYPQIFSPLIFVAVNLIALYSLRKAGLRASIKSIVSVVSSEKYPLLGIFVFLGIFSVSYYLSSPSYGFPWFDIWMFLGVGYLGATGNVVNLRYSYFFPGQFSLFDGGLLASVFSIFPSKSTVLAFMRYVPFLIIYLQAIGIYAISKELVKGLRIVTFVKDNTIGILSALAFLTSTWTLFYAAVFVRESIGILLVLGILGSLILFEKTKPHSGFLFLAIVLSVFTVYVSPVQTAVMIPIFVTVPVFLVRDKVIRVVRKKAFVLCLIAIVFALIPFILSQTVIQWRLANGIIGEPIPGLPSSYHNLNIGHYSFNNNNTPVRFLSLDLAMQLTMYLIVASLGIFGFLVSFFGLLTLKNRIKDLNLAWMLILVYALILLAFPLWGPFLNLIAGDLRRLTFSTTVILSFFFALGINKIIGFQRVLKNPKRKKSFLTILLVLEIAFGLMISPKIDLRSPTTATEFLMKIDSNLPNDVMVVVDSPFMSQALILSPRYTIDPGDFASAFHGVSNDSSLFNSLVSYMAKNRVAILKMEGLPTPLSEIFDTFLKTNPPQISITPYQIVYDLVTARWYLAYIITPADFELSSESLFTLDDFENHQVKEISDADSPKNWFSTFEDVRIDQADRVQGTGSTQASGQKDFYLKYVSDPPLNLSEFDYLSFYAKSSVASQSFQVYLRDGKTQRWYNLQFQNSNTWEQFLIPLDMYDGETGDLNIGRISEVEFWMQYVTFTVTIGIDDLKASYFGWVGTRNIPHLDVQDGIGIFSVETSGKDQWWMVDKPCNINASEYHFLLIRAKIEDSSIPIYIEMRDELNQIYPALFLNKQSVASMNYNTFVLQIPSNTHITKVRIGFHSYETTPINNYHLYVYSIAFLK